MSNLITVQALRDAPLTPPIKKGEKRDYPVYMARALVHLGLVKLAPAPRKTQTEE